MLKLYAFATPNNLKPVILLEELGLPYALESVNIRQGEQKAPQFLALNPNAKVPVLVDSESSQGELVLSESAAILVYLAEKHDQFIPKDLSLRAKVFEQLFFHASGISPAFGNAGYFQKMAPEKLPIAIDRFLGEAKRLIGLLDQKLATQPYVCGSEYTIADMAHFGWFWRSAFVGIDLSEWHQVQMWFETIASRTAVKKAIEKIQSLAPAA
jgi:GST-like protein